MKKILIQLNEWFAKSKAKHGYNIKAGTKQFCIIRKAGPMSEKEPKWFIDYRVGQNEINTEILALLGKLSNKVDKNTESLDVLSVKVDNLESKVDNLESKVNTNTSLIKQAHPELF